MSINSNTRDTPKSLSVKGESKRDIYISYNSLSQRGVVKSVSQSMHNYIKEGFEKIKSKKDSS